ncbi:hypothetical protein LV779_18215 [Streptomyces thinghirensis]|nr:hypothetical protein [Streptomyces thinghirensis]
MVIGYRSRPEDAAATAELVEKAGGRARPPCTTWATRPPRAPWWTPRSAGPAGPTSWSTTRSALRLPPARGPVRGGRRRLAGKAARQHRGSDRADPPGRPADARTRLGPDRAPVVEHGHRGCAGDRCGADRIAVLRGGQGGAARLLAQLGLPAWAGTRTSSSTW